MQRIILPMFALACSTSPVAEQVVDQATPPLTLQVPDLYEDATFTIEVTGAVPGSFVGVAAAPAPATPGLCPPYLNGSCVQLSTPAWLGIERAGPSGSISLQITVPPFLDPGDLVWFQAAAVSGGAPAITSSTTVREVVAADCPDIVDAFWTESVAVRACSVDADCGVQLTGTSCGCTRDWVAAIGVDTQPFYDLLAEAADCGVALISTCDCPQANGYACVDSQCTWNYVP